MASDTLCMGYEYFSQKFTRCLLLSMLISTVSILQNLILEKYFFYFFINTALITTNLIVLKLQLPRPQTRPAWQTEHTGREEDHILRICAVIVAADALHRRYNHHNRRTSGTAIRPILVP